MCGITGLWILPGREPRNLADTVARMVATLAHRGPDDRGHWVDPAAGIGIGQTRLAIIDLSAAGHQPMASPAGRFTVVFNGEIYNHAELRAELERTGVAPAWRGHSDTETLLAAIEHWGVAGALRRSVGMFALALWDRRERSLWLARDRFGEKPLYYGWADGAFVFGSELKALRAHPGFAGEICREALADYLRFAYVPAPRAIYRGTYKLPPGGLLRIQGQPPLAAPAQPLSAPATHESLQLSAWWSVADAMQHAAREPIDDDEEGIRLLEQRLSEAVKLQSLADVPLGAFLSGGVDSTTIVALMQRQSSRRVQTFTVGFREQDFDEAPYSRAVARHLGTDHHELRVSPAEARAVIPGLPAMYDEPFADSSQIPTHLVCRAARQKVTVALSGDAGDELFGGYNRYLWAPRIWRHVGWLPYSARQALSHTLRAAASAGGQSLVPMPRVQRPTDQARKLAVAMRGARSVDDLYSNLVACWPAPQDVMADGSAGIATDFPPALPRGNVDDARWRMMYWDAATYLPDDILCKVDRAAMAISLETRVPFLDHRVAELAWRLPVHMKIRGTETKWVLRQILYRHIPRELIERPKSGFAIPLADWLRGPLRGWVEDLLDERRLRAEGFFHPQPIREAWRQHLTGGFDWSDRLWTVLMFECWLAQSASAQAGGPT